MQQFANILRFHSNRYRHHHRPRRDRCLLRYCIDGGKYIEACARQPELMEPLQTKMFLWLV